MDNACLVTKLNATVNDDSLEKLGVVKLHIVTTTDGSNAPGANISYIISYAERPNTVFTIVGNGYFTDSTGAENYGKSKITTASEGKLFFSKNSEFDLEISNKYKVKQLLGGNGISPSCALSVLKYLTSITQITLVSTSTGDIKELSGLTTLTSLSLTYATNVTGDIKNLGGLVLLTNLGLYGTSCYGEINELASAMVASGRTSGTLTIVCGNSDITYNGESVSYSKTVTFTAEGYTVS